MWHAYVKALQLEWLCARHLQHSGQSPHHRRLQLENTNNGWPAIWAILAQPVSMKRTISIDIYLHTPCLPVGNLA